MSFSYWNYFLAIESDLARLSRYIEFNDDNFNAYSIEMAHLLLAAASEVDVVAKQHCKIIDPGKKPEKINEYRIIYIAKLPEIKDIKVYLPRYNLEVTPWSYWDQDKTPEWWSAYNKVKHQRGDYFNRANLKNVLDAIGGLFVILLLFYRSQNKKTRLNPTPMLFKAPIEIAQLTHTLSGKTDLCFE